MKTFATLALPGTYTGPAGQPLVGRLVANTEFLRALFRHGGFEQYWFFVGEARDREGLRELFLAPGDIAPERLLTPNLLELPGALQGGALSVLHHAAHVDQFFDLVWLRDRYAPSGAAAGAVATAVPVTGQIHSLSYPRMMQSYLRGLLHPPGAGDAIFCSSSAGRSVVEKSFAAAAASAAAAFAPPATATAATTSPATAAAPTAAAATATAAASRPLACELPVVPLGIDVDRLRPRDGDRQAARARLGIPQDALVALALGRFTEYDKMDLFPLLEVFARVRARRPAGARPIHLLLAGARQGTQTPEMLALWAKLFGVGAQVTLSVDFPETEKRQLLAASDLFVSPCDNLQETFGISVVEALAAGLPAVVSDFDGYKDTVTPDVGIRVATRWPSDLSFLAEMGPLLYERPLHLLLGQSVEVDLPALEEALFALFADDRRRAEMSLAATARARAHYDWRVVIPAYEAVWRRLAATPAATPRPPPPARHPLAMDFAEIFSHYPTETIDPARLLRRSELAQTLYSRPGGGYVIYPELKNVFSSDDVVAALALAGDAPLAFASLARALEPRFSWASSWRATTLVIWLLKHGLVR